MPKIESSYSSANYCRIRYYITEIFCMKYGANTYIQNHKHQIPGNCTFTRPFILQPLKLIHVIRKGKQFSVHYSQNKQFGNMKKN